MADELCTEVQTKLVTGDNIEPNTYLLSPIDLYSSLPVIDIIFPVFYKYQIDGDKLADALKKLLDKYPILCGRLHPDKDTQFVIKVDPSDKERCAVLFYEIQSPLTISEAVVKHGRQTKSADGKEFIAFPFFLAKTDSSKKLEGNEPILKVKLTHFADGCCVALTLSHAIADGTRYGKLLCDLSKIYRGEEIGDVCHDRSYLWPDRLVETFPMLGEEMANAPRKVSEKRAEAPSSFVVNGPCELRSLYVPKHEVEALKAKVKQKVGEAQTVSSNDVLTALSWMFFSELSSEKQPIASVGDLDLESSWVLVLAEALANGYKCVPENYFGNAIAPIPCMWSSQSTENEGSMSFVDALTKLATAVRQTVIAFRDTPGIYGQSLAACYTFISTGRIEFPIPVDRYRTLVTNNVEIKARDADFGEGKPILMAFAIVGGMSATEFLLQTGLNQEGFLIHTYLTETRKNFLKESAILRELVPGAKELLDYTANELAQAIGLEK